MGSELQVRSSPELKLLSKVARATRVSDPSQEMIVCVSEGRRIQTRFDGASDEWRIERLTAEEGAQAIAGREYLDTGTSGAPWNGVWSLRPGGG